MDEYFRVRVLCIATIGGIDYAHSPTVVGSPHSFLEFYVARFTAVFHIAAPTFRTTITGETRGREADSTSSVLAH